MKDGKGIWYEGVNRPIPCSERSIQVRLARKIHQNQRQKKNLNGLYEVLALGSTVCKISPTTSVVNLTDGKYACETLISQNSEKS